MSRKLSPDRLLIESAKRGHLGGVKKAVKLGANLRTHNDILLRTAGELLNLDWVDWCISKGLDINSNKSLIFHSTFIKYIGTRSKKIDGLDDKLSFFVQGMLNRGASFTKEEDITGYKYFVLYGDEFGNMVKYGYEKTFKIVLSNIDDVFIDRWGDAVGISVLNKSMDVGPNDLWFFILKLGMDVAKSLDTIIIPSEQDFEKLCQEDKEYYSERKEKKEYLARTIKLHMLNHV